MFDIQEPVSTDADEARSFHVLAFVIDEEAPRGVAASRLERMQEHLGIGLCKGEFPRQQQRIEARDFRVRLVHYLPVVFVDVGQQNELVALGQGAYQVSHPRHGFGVGLKPGRLEIAPGQGEAVSRHKLLVQLIERFSPPDEVTLRDEASQGQKGCLRVFAVRGQAPVDDVVVERDEDTEQIKNQGVDLLCGVLDRAHRRCFHAVDLKRGEAEL